MKAPEAKRRTLVFAAGVVWSVVGLIMLVAAIRWMAPFQEQYHFLWLIGAIAAGFLIYRFGFSRLVAANISRIFSQAPGKDKVCFFSFQNTKSYILILFMIALGYTLRHLPIPKLYLAPIYAAIGLALILSSLIYYRRLKY